MSKTAIVLSRKLPDAMVRLLEKYAEVRVGGSNPRTSAFEDAGIYVTTALDPVPESLIDLFPQELNLIANLGVGTDNIDLAAAATRGISVCNTPVVTEDTADLTFALLLMTCRRLSVCERFLRAGDWVGAQGHPGQRVHGKTLGIIGFGAIGQAVARRATGFGMNILYHGPNRKHEAEESINASYRSNLAALLGESDIVSLHCALTPSTRHILNASTFKQMKSGAVVINTGRGALIHEAALVDALANSHLGGAGLDVFEFEPRVTPKLLEFDNVTLLPHIGSATGECRTDMAMRLAANIEQFLATGTPLDPCHQAETR